MKTFNVISAHQNSIKGERQFSLDLSAIKIFTEMASLDNTTSYLGGGGHNRASSSNSCWWEHFPPPSYVAFLAQRKPSRPHFETVYVLAWKWILLIKVQLASGNTWIGFRVANPILAPSRRLMEAAPTRWVLLSLPVLQKWLVSYHSHQLSLMFSSKPSPLEASSWGWKKASSLAKLNSWIQGLIWITDLEE